MPNVIDLVVEVGIGMIKDQDSRATDRRFVPSRRLHAILSNIYSDVVGLEQGPGTGTTVPWCCVVLDVRVGLDACPSKIAHVNSLAVTVAGFIIALPDLSTVGPGQGPLGILLAVLSLLLACFAAGVHWESRRVKHWCRVREAGNMAGLQTQTIQRPRISVLGLECGDRVSRGCGGGESWGCGAGGLEAG